MNTTKYFGAAVFSLIAATTAFAQMSTPEPMPMPMPAQQSAPSSVAPEMNDGNVNARAPAMDSGTGGSAATMGQPDMSSGASGTSGSYASGSGAMGTQTSPLLFASDPHAMPQFGMQDYNLYRGN